MSRKLVAAVLGVALSSPAAHAQEHMFRTWFEAPESVMAGETFQVWMWATYEIDGVAAIASGGYYFNTVHASIEVAGALSAFERISPVLDGLAIPWDRGTPDGAWLRDFAMVQVEGVPGSNVEYSNPLPVLMFEVTTAAASRGSLELNLRAPSDVDVPYLAWLDDDPALRAATADWGFVEFGIIAGLVAEPFTVRVIPAPSSLALLALAGVAIRRRR